MWHFKKNIFIYLIATLIFILLVFFVLRLRDQAANTVLKSVETSTSFSKPVFFNIGKYFNNIFSANYLSKRNQFLEGETNKLKSLLIASDSLQKENESLKAALKISLEDDLVLESAQVVFSNTGGLQNTIVINKGSQNGLKEGMNVILADKILVGRLIKVLPNYSQLETIYGPGVSLGAEILGSKVLGLAERNNQGFFYFKLYPADAIMKTGDVLITSVENNIFYKGLIIGEILDQKQNEQGKRSIKEAFKISDLDQVLIIKNEVF